jgi:hypothetical protein
MSGQQFVQQQPITANVVQYVEAQQIGTVVKEYKSKTLMKSILGITLNVLGGAFILGGVLIAVLDHNLKSIETGIIALIFAFVALSFGLFLTRTASHNRKSRIYVASDGLMRVQENQAEVIRWDQVAAVQRGYMQWRTNYFLQAYLLSRRDGSTLVVERSYKDFKKLGKIIEDEVTRRLLPEALDMYNAGHPLYFGVIQVDSQGISVQQKKDPKLLLWNEFNGYKVYDGRLKIKKRASRSVWETILILDIPNLCVLMALIQRITDGA